MWSIPSIASKQPKTWIAKFPLNYRACKIHTLSQLAPCHHYHKPTSLKLPPAVIFETLFLKTVVVKNDRPQETVSFVIHQHQPTVHNMKFNVRNFHEISLKKTLFIPLFKLVQHLEIMSIFLDTNSKGLVLS